MTTAGKGAAAPRMRARRTARDDSAAVADTEAAAAPPALRPPRQSRSEESLAKMIHAGRDLIEQHACFDTVVISDVIRVSGTSTGAFYGRFKDKDAFVESVLDVVFAELRVNVDQWISEDRALTDGTASDIARSVVRYYVEMCRLNRGMFKAVLRHFASRDPDANPMRWLDRHVRECVVPLLAAKLPHLTKANARFEVESAVQMVVGTLVLTLLTDPGPLHFDGGELEGQLQLMMRRFLQLP
ncbi:TetR family transcriptional regulator [Burkholderia sp. SRS-46]|nr:TetR family transcriptional regulator [Burkholderia sp. SRS-46]